MRRTSWLNVAGIQLVVVAVLIVVVLGVALVCGGLKLCVWRYATSVQLRLECSLSWAPEGKSLAFRQGRKSNQVAVGFKPPSSWMSDAPDYWR